MNNNDKIIALDKIIKELQRRYDLIQDSYRSAQFKMITFLGAGFGLLTYLYSGDNLDSFYFVPDETYGIVLYILSLTLIGGSMYKLYVSLRGFHWEYPCYSVHLKEIEKCKKNILEINEYIRDEYIRATNINQEVYDKIHRTINDSSLMLVAGGILVILIKIFNK